MTTLNTPTTQAVADGIVAQVSAKISQTIPAFLKDYTRVVAKALAGLYILIYKFAGKSLLQQFVATAEDRDLVINGKTINPLRFWGNLIGEGDPIAAVPAELTLDVTVINQTGSLSAKTQMLGASNGVTYITTAAVALSAPTVQVNVVAVGDQTGWNGSGAIGNLDNGATVNFVNTPAQVQRAALVAATVTTGAEAEDTEAYRARVSLRYQRRPRGGAPIDYVLWGLDVAGVTNIYPYKAAACPGQVLLYVQVDPTVDPDGIPDPATLQAVQDAANEDSGGLATRRPFGHLVTAQPIVRNVIDVDIFGLNVDDPVTVQADIDAALAAFFLTLKPYIQGVSPEPRADRITTAGVTAVVHDVVEANNGIFTSLTLEETAVAFELKQLTDGETVKVGTVDYL